MLADRSSFSHAYIEFNSEFYQRNLIYQASGLSVNFIGEDLFNSKEVTVKEFTIPISDEAKKQVVQFAIDHAGLPYNIGGVVGIGAVKFCALFGKRIKNPITGNGYFCSELAAQILQDFEDASFSSQDIQKMTPTDLYDYLQAKYG